MKSINFANLKLFSTHHRHEPNSAGYVYREVNRPDPDQINNDTFSKYLNHLSSSMELRDADMDLGNMMGILSDPNFSFKELIGKSKPHSELTPEEREKLEEERKQHEERIKESEKYVNYTDLFNKWTEKMIDNTSPRILNELAIRLFVGSRDIPKDVPTAMKLIEKAQEKKSELSNKDKYNIEYFKIMLRRMDSGKTQNANDFWDVNSELKELAEKGQPNAMFTYGMELLMLCQNNVIQDKRLVKK